MSKCEWCEEHRYTSLRNTYIESKYIWCLNPSKDEKGFKMEILRQKFTSPLWEIRFNKYISYCPFCGRYLGSDKDGK